MQMTLISFMIFPHEPPLQARSRPIPSIRIWSIAEFTTQFLAPLPLRTHTCVGYLISVKGHGILPHKNKVPKKHDITRKRVATTQTKSQQRKKFCNRGRHSKKVSDLRKKTYFSIVSTGNQMVTSEIRKKIHLRFVKILIISTT